MASIDRDGREYPVRINAVEKVENSSLRKTRSNDALEAARYITPRKSDCGRRLSDIWSNRVSPTWFCDYRAHGPADFWSSIQFSFFDCIGHKQKPANSSAMPASPP
jgi:hypothetical protein